MSTLQHVPRAIASGVMRFTALTFLTFLSLQEVYAQQFGGDLPSIPGTADGGSGEVRNSVVTVINFILGFLALVAVIFVIVGGIRILASAGNEESVTKGRKTIVMALVGLVIIFFARLIVGFFTTELAEQF